MSKDERQFWESHSLGLEQVLQEYHAGPDPNTRLMMDALEPLNGRTVLDVGCGSGLITAWLAARGAIVTGVDLTPSSLDTAQAVMKELGTEATFIVADLNLPINNLPTFDRLAGRYALHHLSLATAVPFLASRLKKDCRGAFVETMDLSIVLRLARRHLPGRLGIARYGTPQERPLGAGQLELLRNAFGELELQLGEMIFVRLIDRQVLRYRFPQLSKVIGRVDDQLYSIPYLRKWSYHQVVVVNKTARAKP